MKKKNEIIDFLMITMGAIIAAFAIEVCLSRLSAEKRTSTKLQNALFSDLTRIWHPSAL